MGNSNSRNSDRKINSLLQKQSINKEALNALKNRLQICFPNGTVSKKDFIKIYTNYYKSSEVSEFANRLFELFDIDKDNQLSFKVINSQKFIFTLIPTLVPSKYQ